MQLVADYHYIPDKGNKNGAYNRVWKNGVGTITTAGDIKILEERVNIPGLFHKSFNSENFITPEHAKNGVGTITATGALSKQKILEQLESGELKIRSLTPYESLRLMGQPEKNILALTGYSKSTLYFVAGNSMVVPVMEYIVKHFTAIVNE